MQTHHDPMSTATTRIQQIAAMHAGHARQLERAVGRRVRAAPQTIEDACSFAWMQLTTHTSIDLGPPRWRALAWLARTAVHEAMRLEAKQARDELVERVAIERERRLREQPGSGADELAAQHARLDLVAEIPERPRRFLLRLALGHSYREIAAVESVSLTTTDKQIARAKRLLRAVEAADTTRGPSSLGRAGTTGPRRADITRTAGAPEHAAR